ncbi:ECF transporter S component [Facklamia sp. DSM 111018]|uniref:ECF transporter S component n=1 Tax=Facklamia lactis TaxID=2749967 RepID=A0ABS0LNA1_9LACT|nr:ECF transporter S component [Facklamia lactis]MBG9979878.1 ECF transporter S component [Facklamia lactis]MBG9985442.1 ECF transporter S component [Facklamia lactis]
MKKISRTHGLVLAAIFAAITTIFTMLVRIPIPNGQGYLNIGDGILMTASLLFGPFIGFGVGGIGSALADILSGYAMYAPFTFAVKGIEAFLAGYLFHKCHIKWMATLIAGIVMAGGYFATDFLLYDLGAASVGLPMNIGQGVLGSLMASLLYPILNKMIPQIKPA